MKFKVDDLFVLKEQIGMPTMNFGQMWRYKGYKKVNYEILINVEEFYKEISDWFKAFRLDAIEDYGGDEKGEFPVYDKYEEQNFPELEKLIKSDITLFEEIIKFHDIDILNLLCQHEVSGAERVYSINSLDEISIDEIVQIRGVAFQIIP